MSNIAIWEKMNKMKQNNNWYMQDGIVLVNIFIDCFANSKQELDISVINGHEWYFPAHSYSCLIKS
jgi:hypothetical protein